MLASTHAKMMAPRDHLTCIRQRNSSGTLAAGPDEVPRSSSGIWLRSTRTSARLTPCLISFPTCSPAKKTQGTPTEPSSSLPVAPATSSRRFWASQARLRNHAALRPRARAHVHRILRCLASIYGIDISAENVDESRYRLRAVIKSHLDNDLNTQALSRAFVEAAEVILETNIIHADTLAHASTIELVAYRPERGAKLSREVVLSELRDTDLDLFFDARA